VLCLVFWFWLSLFWFWRRAAFLLAGIDQFVTGLKSIFIIFFILNY